MQNLLFVVLGLFFIHPFSMANTTTCTDWTEESSISCVDKYGTWGKSWVRQCTKFPCADLDPDPYRVIFAHGCNLEKICSKVHPTKIKNCTPWQKEKNFSCPAHTGSFEQEWSRICLKGGMAESFCSDTINPNTMKTACTEWVKHSGESCASKEGKFELKWTRQCLNNIYHNTEFCSNKLDPNTI